MITSKASTEERLLEEKHSHADPGLELDFHHRYPFHQSQPEKISIVFQVLQHNCSFLKCLTKNNAVLISTGKSYLMTCNGYAVIMHHQW